MGFYRDTGVVLRLQKLGEADRIVTILTHRHGKVRAVAKGVRRTSSRFGARLEPFGHVDLQLHTGRSLDIVTQVQTLDAFGGGLTGDYPRYTAGCALLETADRLTSEEGEPARELFLLLVGALRGLAGGTRDPYLVLDAFLLRAMVIAGWAPAITECARCGTEGAPYHRRFSVPAGGAVCEPCRPSGSVVPSEETWRLLEALRSGDWGTAEGTDAAARRDTAGLVAAHLQWHLERTLRSLPLVDRRGGVPRVDLTGTPLDVEIADEPTDGHLRPEESTEGALRSEPGVPL
ncbi:DNA repair protein RecO [Actinomycetospora flava]|uniref:DNA repair protein RecO n=1 Tax=Actinomycetospora flava TaxID=3129232 RepID=A0ABU8M498_9PSEU